MRLYTLAISHYCEKARWALDYKRLDYEEVVLVPGPHSKIQKIAPKTELPVLEDGDDVIQGSGEIIDYLEQRYPERPLTPDDPRDAEAGRELERRLDAEVGEAVRRVFYFHSLPDKRFLLRHFLAGAPWWWRVPYVVTYRWLGAAMSKHFGLAPERIAADVEQLSETFRDLEDRMSRSGFLFGSAFSRADLTLAALTAHFHRPVEHPISWLPDDQYPDGLSDVLARWEGSPLRAWVREQYRARRHPQSA